MRKHSLYSTLLLSALTISFVACKKDDPAPVVVPTTVKEWNIPLAAKNENNPPAGRTETGTANIKLLSDNTITYTISVTGLAAGDALTAAHIHVGDVISNGSVILGFSPTFTGSTATGTITSIRSTFIDSLKDDVNELYFNVHSTQVPGGLVRGQLNTDIEMAEFVTLSGANEVPAVTTTATGTALIRITSEKKIYTKVTISNLESGDALTASHIHKAAAGTNGGVILGFYASAADFGTAKVSTLTDALYTSIKTDPIYINAHSTAHPGGIVRGQIR
jgi:hypothetical protein